MKIFIVFFTVYGIMCFLNGYEPYYSDRMMEYFGWSIMGIISLGFASIIYILHKKD